MYQPHCNFYASSIHCDINLGTGFVLTQHAGETTDYASSRVNNEGTFRAGRVSLNADRWVLGGGGYSLT
jgi:hypothetical protein